MRKKKLTEKGYFSLSGFSELQWYVVVVVALSVLLIGWTSIMNLLGYNVSFFNIVYLHNYLFVWLFDAAVFILVAGALYVTNFKRLSLKALEDDVDNLENEITQSIDIAEKIRGGEDIDDFSDNHTQLGLTLLNLGKSLQESREKERQNSWVTLGKGIISDILRANNKIDDLADASLKGIIDYYGAAQGAFYIMADSSDKGYKCLRTVTQYAYDRKRFEQNEVRLGYGLIGAAAYEKQLIYRTEIPDDYFSISSGLIDVAKPSSLLIIPLKQENEVQGVIELSFFEAKLPGYYMELAEEIGTMVGSTIFNLNINATTERLLQESRQMTKTLKENEAQLQRNAQEMLAAKEDLERSNYELAQRMDDIKIAQKKQEAMLSNASEFISIYNAQREIEYESPSINKILGYEPSEVVHGMDEDMMTPQGYRSIQAMFDYLMQTPGGEMLQQYQYLKKSGDRIYLETSGKNLIHDPAIRGLIFNTRDITERKRAEREQRMRGRMQSLSENSPDMILRTSANGKIVYANPAAAKFIGIQELVNLKISELDAQEEYKQFLVGSLRTVKRSRQSEQTEIKVVMDDEERILEMKAIPEAGDNNEMESVLFTAHDVTVMKKLEEEAREKTKKIQDSINYALRIQQAMLPVEATYQEFFPNAFMFYRPKDIVSGDFPWYFHSGDVHYIAAVDCTGHGVPGALLSIIGTLLLKFIVSSGNELTAAEILTNLHESVRDTLKQHDANSALSGDGMDMGLCRVDKASGELQFAGAHRPLYFMRNGELTEYKATSKGIGGKPLPGGRPEKEFENNVIQYQPGDRFFVFSDGLPDQLGGGVHKKFQTKRIKDLLLRDANESMHGISQDLIKDFYAWVGDENQVDDVLLIGVEL